MDFLNIKRGEIAFVSLVGIVIILLISVPYVLGYVNAPILGTYLGASNLLSADYYSYLAWIAQAHDGVFFMRNLFGSEYADANFVHPVFYAVGLCAKILNISIPLAYHIGRTVAVAIFVFIAYGFFAQFTQNITERRIALALLLLGPGFGIFFGLYSVDLWVPEAITFLSLYLSLLNTISLCIILLVCIIVRKYFYTQNWSAVIITGLLLNLLTLTHTYDLLLIGSILGVFACITLYMRGQSTILYNVLWVYAITFPSLLWQIYVLVDNQALSVWYFQQMSTVSPDVLSYASGFGALLVLAVWGIYLSRKHLGMYVLPIVWICVVATLVYNPLLPSLQRKFIEGFQIPLALFASIPLARMWVVSNTRKFFVVLLIILTASTNIALLYVEGATLMHPNGSLVLSSDELRAVTWIKENTLDTDIILSGVFLGNVIPALTARPVYIGHHDQTINFESKKYLLDYAFSLDANTPRLWKKILYDGHIRYVVEDTEVRSHGGSIAHVQGLIQVFKSDTTTIYRVTQ